jgi:prefoldin subunit 5
LITLKLPHDDEQGLKEKGKKQVLIKPKEEVDEAIKDNHQVQALKKQIQTLQQHNQELEKKHSKLQKKYQKLQRKHQKTCFFLKEII